jgi:beta-N-acetylhexosaminidase
MMVAHLQIPALDPDGWPASLSPRIITGLLREQMGYEGVVMTDDMGMGAISDHHSLGEAAVQAVLAGNDLLLNVELGSESDHLRSALLGAVAGGQIPMQRIDEAVRRIIRLKLAYRLDDVPPAPPLLGQEEHLQLASQAGRAAVRVLRDGPGWLPLQLPNRRILLLSPTTLPSGAVAGNGLSILGELLAARGVDVEERFYIPDAAWSVAQLQSEALALASVVDAVVVLTYNDILRHAHFQDDSQETLVTALLATGQPLVVVFSQLPYDQERMPQVPTQIATYGDTIGQIEGLASALMGE